MATKKEDPDFTVLRGHVPKELFKRFKVFCIEEDLDNSEGLERVVQGYFESADTNSANKKKE